jgi:hypothetical protein
MRDYIFVTEPMPLENDENGRYIVALPDKNAVVDTIVAAIKRAGLSTNAGRLDKN